MRMSDLILIDFNISQACRFTCTTIVTRVIAVNGQLVMKKNKYKV